MLNMILGKAYRVVNRHSTPIYKHKHIGTTIDAGHLRDICSMVHANIPTHSLEYYLSYFLDRPCYYHNGGSFLFLLSASKVCFT